MTQYHYTARGWVGLSRPFVPTMATQQVNELIARRTANDILVRTSAWPKFVARVDNANPPFVLGWWSDVVVLFGIDFESSNGQPIPDVGGASRNYVLVGRLKFSNVIIDTVTSTYVVVWEGPPDGYVSEGIRKGAGVFPDLPRARIMIKVIDPSGTLGLNQHLFAVQTYFDAYVTSLWASTVNTPP